MNDDAFVGGFGRKSATYTFSGVPGSGTTSTAGSNSVTEVITQGSRSSTIVFTALPSDASLYQVSSITNGSHTITVTPKSPSPTFAFHYEAQVKTTTVTETISNAIGSEAITYISGTNGVGASYALSNDTFTFAKPSTSHTSYSFGTAGSITETDTRGAHTFSHTDPLGPTTSLTGVGTATVTETVISGNSVIATTFVGSEIAGYAISQISTTYVPQGSSSIALDIDPYDRAKFDFAAHTVTHINNAGSAGSPQSMTANSKISFADLGSVANLAGTFVGETITNGGHTSFEIYFSSTGAKGEYMEVAHGTGAANVVNLVGIASQIATLDGMHLLTT